MNFLSEFSRNQKTTVYEQTSNARPSSPKPRPASFPRPKPSSTFTATIETTDESRSAYLLGVFAP